MLDSREDLIRKNLIQENLIKNIIEKRGISYLCHFTPRENLESIRKNGLVLRNSLPNNAIITDTSRYDTYSNAISLSISIPNIDMWNIKVKQGFNLALIILSPKILYEKNCLFYPHNAATKCYKNVHKFAFQGSKALEKLFDNKVSWTTSTRGTFSAIRKSNQNSHITTSVQAEVQCLENIETEYMLEIYEIDSQIQKYVISQF